VIRPAGRSPGPLKTSRKEPRTVKDEQRGLPRCIPAGRATPLYTGRTPPSTAQWASQHRTWASQHRVYTASPLFYKDGWQRWRSSCPGFGTLSWFWRKSSGGANLGKDHKTL